MTTYAKGPRAWGECQRSGLRTLRKNLVRDGYVKGMMVLPDWYDPPHPQEHPKPINDPIGVRHPAPELSKFSQVLTFPIFSTDTMSYTRPLIINSYIGVVGVSAT